MGFAGSGQVEYSGSGSVNALNGAVTINIPTSSSLVFHFTGTYVATFTFEASVDGTNFFTIPATQVSNGAQVTTASSVGAYLVGVGGYATARVRASDYSSGTAAIAWSADNTPNIQSTVQQGNAPWSTVIADSHQLDAFGRIRVSETDLIESLHFSHTAHPLLTNTALTGSATSAYNGDTSSVRFTCTTSSSDSVIFQTKRYFRYNPGRSYLVTLSGNVGAKKANVRQRYGYFDGNNGLFFEQDSSNLKVVIRTNASGSPVDTAVNQSSWNLDKLDGTGVSGINLDTTKHNLYVIDFLWHGAGRVRFGVFYNGQIVYCHQVNGANVSATPFMRTPSLPVRVELTNTSTTASTTTMDFVCFAYVKEAADSLTAPYIFTTSHGATSTTVGNTLLPIVAIRPKATFNSRVNRVSIIPRSLQVAANQNLIYVVCYLNPTLTGASWTSVDTNSAVEYDISATALSGGTKVREFYVPASSSLTGSISEDVRASLELITLGLDIAGSTQDTFVIAARSTAGGTACWAQIDWQEFQ